MEIEQLLDLSSLTLSTSQSTQQEPPYPKPLNVPSSHPVSTPASQQRNSSRRRRLSIAMPWAVEILSEISDSESEADGWQHTVTHGEQVADNEGSYVARGIEEIQEENLSRCESTDNDGEWKLRFVDSFVDVAVQNLMAVASNMLAYYPTPQIMYFYLVCFTNYFCIFTVTFVWFLVILLPSRKLIFT